MEITKSQKIGTYFKKENIFLATVSEASLESPNILNSKLENNISEKLLEMIKKKDFVMSEELIEMFEQAGFLTSEQYDIFYKDENGYTRFVEEGPETFIGDNSDGKGIIRNVISIWDYYSEDEIQEVMINNKFMAISSTNEEPLHRYNKDYNLS